MPELSTSAILEAPAQSVWEFLEDFGHIQRWWPDDGAIQIERVELEGEGIGMIRHIYNKGAKHCVSERLDLLDPETRTIILSIVGNRPRGITAYVAQGRIVDLEGARCRIDYRANVTTDPGQEEKVSKALLMTWSLMFHGLERAAANSNQGLSLR